VIVINIDDRKVGVDALIAIKKKNMSRKKQVFTTRDKDLMIAYMCDDTGIWPEASSFDDALTTGEAASS
jgi:hypothetical protein